MGLSHLKEYVDTEDTAFRVGWLSKKCILVAAVVVVVGNVPRLGASGQKTDRVQSSKPSHSRTDLPSWLFCPVGSGAVGAITHFQPIQSGKAGQARKSGDNWIHNAAETSDDLMVVVQTQQQTNPEAFTDREKWKDVFKSIASFTLIKIHPVSVVWQPKASTWSGTIKILV